MLGFWGSSEVGMKRKRIVFGALMNSVGKSGMTAIVAKPSDTRRIEKVRMGYARSLLGKHGFQEHDRIEDYKKKTGRQWHDDDWEKNWYEAFEDLLGERVDLDECYKILGLSKGVEFSQVKKRYRELALKHHPDKCQDKEEAERKFKEIVNAYEAIRNSMEEMTA